MAKIRVLSLSFGLTVIHMPRLLDVFPANVCLTDKNFSGDPVSVSPKGGVKGSVGVLSVARVILTADRIYIGVDAAGGPQTVFAESYTQKFAPDAGKIIRVITSSGRVIAFQKDKHCGCGSRLRNWSPTTEQGISRA